MFYPLGFYLTVCPDQRFFAMKLSITFALKTCVTLLVGLCLTGPATAANDAYPTRPITIIVPQTAGGGSDIVTRRVALKMAEVIGQSLVIDNRAGAGGNIGTVQAMQAKPDGYTILMSSNNHVINPALYRNAGFDPVKDFIPIGLMVRGTLLLVAHPSFPANSVAELIAAAKQAPNSLFYASAGNGTINHLAMTMVEQMADVAFTHVPYKGQAAAMTDVVGGLVPFTFSALASSRPYIESGRIKVLAVVNEARLPVLPDVPTIGETIPGYAVTPWYGLFALAGTPEHIVNTLHQALHTALQDEELKNDLAQLGMMVAQNDDRAAFTTMIAHETDVWTRAIQASGARVD